MKYNFKEVKTGVFGIQGSGKTYFVEHSLIKSFRKPFVYLMHPEDFQTCGNNVMTYTPTKLIQRNGKAVKVIDKSPEHLDRILGVFIEEAKQGKYDAFILDESSTFLPKNYDSLKKYPNIIDFVDNHRHYGKQKRGYGTAFVYMARRPETISTEITETSEHLFLFAIDGVNVKDYFAHIHEDYKILMPKLSKQKHNFIHKELGVTPKLYDKIKTEKKQNGR